MSGCMSGGSLMSACASTANAAAGTGGRRPADLRIQPRTPSFDLSGLMQKYRYWHGNDPVVTHFFNALQATFPEGERFFIDSARDAREHIGEENLSEQERDDVKRFIRQEAIHGKAHDDWTKALIAAGYPRFTEFDEEMLKERTWARKNVPMKVRIALTAGAEHLTASMARLFLERRTDLIEDAQPPVRDLLLWHAVEEIEHKAVCFDLYERVDGRYGLRVFALGLALMDMLRHVRERQEYLLKKDGLWNWRTRIRMATFVWGPRGLVTSLLPYLLDYLNPGFHPWKHDERAAFEAKYGEIVRQATATA